MFELEGNVRENEAISLDLPSNQFRCAGRWRVRQTPHRQLETDVRCEPSPRISVGHPYIVEGISDANGGTG